MEQARRLLDEGLVGTGKAALGKLDDRVLETLAELLGGSPPKDAPACREALVKEIMKMKRACRIPNKASPYFAKERKIVATASTPYDSDAEAVLEGFTKLFDAPAVLPTKRDEAPGRRGDDHDSDADTVYEGARRPLEPPAVLSTKKDEAPGRRDPPPAHIQLLRSAGACQPLLAYLKDNGKFDSPGRAHWNAISQWTKTAEGMDWLRRCEIDPLGVQLDHVCSRSGVGSGFDSVFNCCFLPPGPNGWFADYDTREKRDYIGKYAVELSKRYSAWIRGKVVDLAKRHTQLFNQGCFDPHVIH